MAMGLNYGHPYMYMYCMYMLYSDILWYTFVDFRLTTLIILSLLHLDRSLFSEVCTAHICTNSLQYTIVHDYI